MAPRKLTPVQVLERLLTRLGKRIEVLQRVKLNGFQMVISELEVEPDYLRRAKHCLENWAQNAPIVSNTSRQDRLWAAASTMCCNVTTGG
jgi:hypothetical protein